MSSRRGRNARIRRWDIYMNRVSRSAAPNWCDDCQDHHAGVAITPGYFGSTSVRRRMQMRRAPKWRHIHLPPVNRW